jgi:capsid protein
MTVLDNAIIEHLKPGDKVNINAADVPGESFSPFTKFILQMLAVSVGVPYELVAGDYGGLNYNTTRTVRNDFAKATRPIIRRHCRQFGVQVNRAFFDALYLTGKVNMPGYQQNPRHWREGLWQPPGVEPLDLLRESRGQIDLVKNLLYSPQEIIIGRGRDPEEVLNEIQEFKRMVEARGLSLEEVSTALQTNPAAVAANGNKVGATQIKQDEPEISKERAETFKTYFDAYGVGVRAGGLTPQPEDEELFRGIMGLTDMSNAVKEAWEEDGYARRPITLKSQVEFDAQADASIQKTGEQEEHNEQQDE